MLVAPSRLNNCKLLGLSIKCERFVTSCEVLGHDRSRMLCGSNVRRTWQVILLTKCRGLSIAEG